MSRVDLWHVCSAFLKDTSEHHTRRAYRSALIKYVGWCVERGYQSPTLSHLTIPLATEFRDFEFYRGAAPSTIALNLKVLKLLDKWCARNGNYNKQLERLRIPKLSEPAFQSESEEVRRGLLNDAASATGSLNDLAAAILIVSYAGLGLRRIEPVRVVSQQVLIPNQRIQAVRMKGGVFRDKVIPASHAGLFRRYEEQRSEAVFYSNVTDDLPFLVHERANRLNPFSDSTAYRWIKRIGSKPHALRHAYARALLDYTKNIRLVAYELGHSCLTVTMGYTRPTMEERHCYHEALYTRTESSARMQ